MNPTLLKASALILAVGASTALIIFSQQDADDRRADAEAVESGSGVSGEPASTVAAEPAAAKTAKEAASLSSAASDPSTPAVAAGTDVAGSPQGTNSIKGATPKAAPPEPIFFSSSKAIVAPRAFKPADKPAEDVTPSPAPARITSKGAQPKKPAGEGNERNKAKKKVFFSSSKSFMGPAAGKEFIIGSGAGGMGLGRAGDGEGFGRIMDMGEIVVEPKKKKSPPAANAPNLPAPANAQNAE